MNSPYQPPSSDTGSRVTSGGPRTVYHFTSAVAGFAWLAATCYAMLVFHREDASIAASSFSNAVSGSVMMSLIVWSAVVRTWWRDSRRFCVVFTVALVVTQAAAIVTMAR
ncbi:hypothetical protein [Rhodopirellula bahusiensis]|uniref:hypothetical protein n=1 Tax=Rhodopirellula bahusiensis TaxID=2014065 RepID=UPI00326371C2